MAMLNASGYTKIAGVLREAPNSQMPGACVDGWKKGVENVTVHLADLFERDSKNFDRQRFYDTVGISIPMEEDQNGKRTG